VSIEWVELLPYRSSPYVRDPKPMAAVVRGEFAYGVWTALAVTLAEPLRKALSIHLDEHGCAERGGFAYCREAMDLFRLLPEGDMVVYA
jgi:hypothetical protein